MTSAQRGKGVKQYLEFVDKQYKKFGQREGGGKKSENFADVI